MVIFVFCFSFERERPVCGPTLCTRPYLYICIVGPKESIFRRLIVRVAERIFSFTLFVRSIVSVVISAIYVSSYLLRAANPVVESRTIHLKGRCRRFVQPFIKRPARRFRVHEWCVDDSFVSRCSIFETLVHTCIANNNDRMTNITSSIYITGKKKNVISPEPVITRNVSSSS